MDVAALLDVEPEDLEEVRSHFTEATYEGRTYRHLSAGFRGIERGTVLIGDTVVRGFPSIPRALVLETGVPAFFSGPLAVEEKLNGYNVRIVDVDGLLAFTRGGHICPYTTQIAREHLDLALFFEAHPEQMLCAEFVGPENPYTAHSYPGVDSVQARIFDVRDRETGTPMRVERRREILSSFSLPQPDLFGVYEPEEAVERVRETITDLKEAGREGVVMQSTDGRDLLKYTTGHQHQQDLAFAFSLPFDYGRDFLFSRLIREGFQAVEFEESPAEIRERAHGLGEAILEPMVETIRNVEAGETVGEHHTIRASPEAVQALLDHLGSQGITVEIQADRRRDGDRVVEFVKISNATRDKIEYYLEGGTIDE
jgi:putative ATP-dependent DNA ligase